MLLVLLTSVLCSFTNVDGLHCTLPDNDSLITLVKRNLNTEVVSIEDGPYYTCQVQGTTMGTYQELSVIMKLTNKHNDALMTILVQFDMDCSTSTGLEWTHRSSSARYDLSMRNISHQYILYTNCSTCNISAGVTAKDSRRCQGPGHLITVHRERRGSSASDCVQCKDTTSDSNNNNADGSSDTSSGSLEYTIILGASGVLVLLALMILLLLFLVWLIRFLKKKKASSRNLKTPVVRNPGIMESASNLPLPLPDHINSTHNPLQYDTVSVTLYNEGQELYTSMSNDRIHVDADVYETFSNGELSTLSHNDGDTYESVPTAMTMPHDDGDTYEFVPMAMTASSHDDRDTYESIPTAMTMSHDDENTYESVTTAMTTSESQDYVMMMDGTRQMVNMPDSGNHDDIDDSDDIYTNDGL